MNIENSQYLACIVVAYNPKSKELSNIYSYAEYAEKVYVIDNSDIPDSKLKLLCEENSKLIYISNGGNKGVAFALNKGCHIAYKKGYKWVLTMDQDSKLIKNSYDMLIEYLKNVEDKVGIVGMSYKKENDKVSKKLVSAKKVREIITSGSAVRLESWKKIGGFDNKLFIDSVDHDFSFKMCVNGYDVVKLNNVYFQHEIGHKVTSGGIMVYNYPPVRYYYIIRNRTYVLKKYGKLFPEERKRLKKIENKIILSALHEDKKWLNIIYMICGYYDYLRKRFGKCRIVL